MSGLRISLFFSLFLLVILSAQPGFCGNDKKKSDREQEKLDRKSAVKALKLEVTPFNIRRDAQYASLDFKAKITNISNKEVCFFFEECGICFWSISINGRKSEPLIMGMHKIPCTVKHLVRLKPGQSVGKIFNRSSDHIKEKDLKSFRLSYHYEVLDGSIPSGIVIFSDEICVGK